MLFEFAIRCFVVLPSASSAALETLPLRELAQLVSEVTFQMLASFIFLLLVFVLTFSAPPSLASRLTLSHKLAQFTSQIRETLYWLE